MDIILRSVSSCVPDKRITNDDVIQMFIQNNQLGFNTEELAFIQYSFSKKLEFLGNRTRSACTAKDSYVDLALSAAKTAIEKAGIYASEIDCIIGTGITNPVREPTLAALIAHELDLVRGIYFDVNDTCNSFMKSLSIASLFLESGRCKNVLIVACEAPFEMPHVFQKNLALDTMDQADNRFSNLLLGTGAGSVILSREGNGSVLKKIREKNETINWDASIVTVANSRLPDTRYQKNRLLGFWTDARNISSEWRRGIVEFVEETMDKWDMDVRTQDVLLLHQLGDNVTYSVLKQLGVEQEKSPVNTYNDLGNLASANIPVLMDRAAQDNCLKKGDSVLLISGGGGFSYSVAHIIW